MESNIRKLRRKLGLTQKELGEQIGVSQQVISRMECERESISVDVLLRLASYFEVSTDRILGLREPEDTIDAWMMGMSSSSIHKGDVLMLVEQTDTLRPGDWKYVWFLINVLKVQS